MFVSRQNAGKLLALRLSALAKKKDLVFGITRGGVVVAYEVARLLDLGLFPIIVKKIGAPYDPELALGAVTYDKINFIDWELVEKLGVNKSFVKSEIAEKYNQVRSLEAEIGLKTENRIKGRNIIVVDDGIATGATIRVVIKYLTTKKAKAIILAVPVVNADIYLTLKPLVKEIIALEVPMDLIAVAKFYEAFPQVDDREVNKLLNLARNFGNN